MNFSKNRTRKLKFQILQSTTSILKKPRHRIQHFDDDDAKSDSDNGSELSLTEKICSKTQQSHFTKKSEFKTKSTQNS